MAPRRAALTAALAAAGLGTLGLPAASAAPGDTTAATIADANGDGRLETGAGEPLALRDDLAARRTAQPGRPIVTFAQLTDTHVIDEESPLRVEFTDRFGSIFTSAYRPQEGLSAHVVDAMVESVRSATGPRSGAPVSFVMTTGDNTDNTQCNETRWMIDLLDGGTVDPNSGVARPGALDDRALCLGDASPLTTPVPPPAACATSDERVYDGVRGGDEFYEPDGPAAGRDGPGYAPQDGLRDFPGLFEAMNRPFPAGGLGLPWYGIFGNHDGLLQGNQPRNPAFEALAVGCAKVRELPAPPSSPADVLPRLLGAPTDTADRIMADQRRRPLRKVEYINEHFRTTGEPVGHGFTEENLRTETGNYAITPAEGLRFLVLDTVADHGLEGGNIDDAQFRWIHDQLLLAASRRERVVLFAHHSLRTMGQPPVSPFAPGDAGGDLDPNVHFGIGPRETGIVLPCRTTRREDPTYAGETLRCLLLRHPAAVAFVNGHEHANRIEPFKARDASEGPGRFWEVNTASHIDWPQQSRVLEVLDNGDGTLSIATAVVDHTGDVDPGDGPLEGGDAGGLRRLAGISRELSYHDLHADARARGDADDRNVELVIDDPFPSTPSARGLSVARGKRPGAPGR